MTDRTSVVTTERFDSGYNYEEYVDQAVKVNKDWFTQLYDDFHIDPEDAQFLQRSLGQTRRPGQDDGHRRRLVP